MNCGRGSVFAIVFGLFFFLRILVSLLVGYGYGQGMIELCLVSYVLCTPFFLLRNDRFGETKIYSKWGFLSVTSSNAFTFRALCTQSCFAVLSSLSINHGCTKFCTVDFIFIVLYLCCTIKMLEF